jgi:hypothetical protein
MADIIPPFHSVVKGIIIMCDGSVCGACRMRVVGDTCKPKIIFKIVAIIYLTMPNLSTQKNADGRANYTPIGINFQHGLTACGTFGRINEVSARGSHP